MSQAIALITLVCTIIVCLIGVAGFMCGMMATAKKEGRMMEKIDQCVAGIDGMRLDIKEQGKVHSEHEKTLVSHGEQIHTLFTLVLALTERVEKHEDRENS